MTAQPNVFPLCDQSSARTMDLPLIRQLTSATTQKSEEEIVALSMSHALFLNHGGGGGAWQMLSASGLPLCIYLGPDASQGSQMVLRLMNIQGAALSDAQLDFADMSAVYAQHVNFSGSSMQHVMAIDSIFDDADFSGCDLTSTDFSGASMKRASFKGANLTGVDFESVDLTSADFSGAILTNTRFPGACLDDVAMP